MQKITINQEYYFPLPVRLFGYFLPLLAIFLLLTDRFILAGVALILAVLFISSVYILYIDSERKVYAEYLKILGFKKGIEISYSTIEGMKIGTRNESRTYNSRGSSHTIKSKVYFLKIIIDGEPIEITSNEKKNKVMSVKNKIEATFDQITTEDHT